MKDSRLSFAVAGGATALALVAGIVAFLRPRWGAAVAVGAGLGFGVGSAATLVAFVLVLRALGRGSRQLFGVFGVGLLAKILLLAGGTLLGHLTRGYDAAAYALAFAAGFALAAAGGIAEVQRATTRAGRERRGR